MQLFTLQCTIIQIIIQNYHYESNIEFLTSKRKDAFDVQLFTKKKFQRNTAKIKMQCKDFLRVRDNMSQLHFQRLRENLIR